MSATNRNGSERIEKDQYPSPHWTIKGLSQKLLENWKLWDEGYPEHIIDAGSGDGRIGKAVKKTFDQENGTNTNLTLVDLEPKSDGDLYESNIYTVTGDFLTYAPPENERILIVSNPPFSASFEFVKRFIEILECSKAGGVACVLLPLNWLGSIKRSQFLKAHPPKSVFVFSTRPSFVKGRTDSSEYGWFCWTDKNIHIDSFQFINKYDFATKVV